MKKYEPNFDNLLKALSLGGKPDKVACWELFADTEVMRDVLGQPDMLQRYMISGNTDPEIVDHYLNQIVEFQLKMGYDYLPVDIHPPLTRTNFLKGDDTAELSKGQRIWVDEHNGTINDWEDFEKYPWKDPSFINFSILERASKKVPDGMKVMVWCSGILENVQWLMGYEKMALTTVDNPELIDALFEKVGKLILSIYENASQMPNVGLFAMGDDMGFKSATLFAPELLRKHVFPWQKRCVDAGHKNNIPFILHSCGNLEVIMDDLIGYVGIDGKHSYEDNILPVVEAKRLYGHRTAIVGGIDIDFLARSSEEEIRKRVRKTLEECLPGGGYLMGSGNSIANYIPVKNYMAMMDEAKKFL